MTRFLTVAGFFFLLSACSQETPTANKSPLGKKSAAESSDANSSETTKDSDKSKNTENSKDGSNKKDTETKGPEESETPLPVPDKDEGSKDSEPLKTRISGVYYPNWTPAPPRIKDIDPNINLIYLFAAEPVGGSPGSTGAVKWTMPGNGKGAATNLKADIIYARQTQKRKIILSVGGAGRGMSFPNRQKSQTFVNSITQLYDQLGGFDGLDWNTFEADQNPATDEMIWMSLELKKKYPGFLISAPPAPWNKRDKDFCLAMVKAGAMDYAAPQYYDGPDLATIDYMKKSVDEWVALLGSEHVAVGFGIASQTNYMKVDDGITVWNSIVKKHPTIRGAFDWSLPLDEEQGYPFTRKIAPLVLTP